MTTWRKSSFSDGQGQCVEVAEVDQHLVLVRNSRRPDGVRMHLDAAAVAAFVAGCSASEFDDLG